MRLLGDGVNSAVTVTKNDLHNNINGVKVGTTAVALPNTVAAHRNRLTGNSGFGVNNLSAFNVDATCNWWGARNGPGPVGPGSGDKVTTNVTFAPWLTSPNLNGRCGNSGGDGGDGGDNGDDGGNGHDGEGSEGHDKR